jgi:hypothetical protein
MGRSRSRKQEVRVMAETKAMTVRLAQAQADELEAVAEIEEIPVAEAVRAAIDSYIADRRQDQDFQVRLKDSLERNRRILERLADA